MAYRFTNTEKWSDSWFSNLKPFEKILFNYICDNCDIAGFIEINYKRWAIDIGLSTGEIEGACKGLERGFINSKDNDCIYVRNFLKHQKNLPLNKINKAHQGILKRFDIYSYKFDIKDVDEFIQRGLQGAYKGLGSPTGNGIGNGIGNEKEEPKIEIENEKFDFETYHSVLNYFGIDDNPANHLHHVLVRSMVSTLTAHNSLDIFKTKFAAYQAYKSAANEKPHGLKTFAGTNELKYMDGGWNFENWAKKLEDFKSQSRSRDPVIKPSSTTYVPVSSYGPDFDPSTQRF